MSTSPGRADMLNRDPSCEGLDADALQRALTTDNALSEWWASRHLRHAHLFSDAAVFISEPQFEAIREAVTVLHGAMSSPAWRAYVFANSLPLPQPPQGPMGAFMGYDFHLTPDGPRLIEINSNAGGAALALALSRAWNIGAYDAHAATPLESVESRWLDMFAHEWARQRSEEPFLPSTGRQRSIAIVDDDPEQQYLHPEFLLFQRFFSAAGLHAVISAPEALILDGGQLKHNGQPIDLVYCRLTDFYLEEPRHAVLREACASGAAVFTPGPLSHACFASKRHLVDLNQPTLLASLGVSDSQREILARIVPEAHTVTTDNAATLWSHRRRYFFKPFAGFGSKAAYRGDKLTTGTWEHIVHAGYVAQAIVPPSERDVLIDSQKKSLKFDVRAYTYGADIHLLAARLYEGQTTNFRTPGGGFAPVFITPS